MSSRLVQVRPGIAALLRFRRMRAVTAPLRSYWTFLGVDFRLVAFGFLLTLSSSFGQTFFIALFSDNIRAELNLSDGGFGLVYSAATLVSAMSLIWVGTLVDHLNLRLMTVAVCLGMCTAALLMAWTPAVAGLLVAIYLLRLNGQGLLGHISITSMARYFTTGRGKAISIASLGYPTGEAVLPLIAVALIGSLGWRQTWLAIAALFIIILIPLALLLLKGHQKRHQQYLEYNNAQEKVADEAEMETTTAAHIAAHPAAHWTRRDTVRDWRFYLLLPAATAPAFIVTGIFFHQVRLVEEKGWTIAWFAACFIAFAAAQLPASLGAGELIDRVGARRLIPFYLVPLGLAMLTLGLVSHPAAAVALMVFIGLTSGGVGPLVNATLAEMYGTRHLGAIRSLSTAVMVFATSLSPFLMGALIDLGMRISTMAFWFLGLIVVASVLVAVAVSTSAKRSGR